MGWGIELRESNLGCRPCCQKGKAKGEAAKTRVAEPSHVVQEPSTSGNYMHENRETSASAAESSPAQEGETHKLGMNDEEESESATVPMKEPNKGRPSRPAEALEGRADAKENRGKPYTDPTQSGKHVSPGLASVRQRARERKTEKFSLHPYPSTRFDAKHPR